MRLLEPVCSVPRFRTHIHLAIGRWRRRAFRSGDGDTASTAAIAYFAISDFAFSCMMKLTQGADCSTGIVASAR